MSPDQKEHEFRRRWAGRTVRHYSVKWEGDVPVTSVKEVKWPDVRTVKSARKGVFKRVKKLPREIVEALPIKPSRTCLFVGVAPFPIGFRPQVIREVVRPWWEFIEKDENADIREAYLQLPQRKLISGSWPTQQAEFQAMCDPVQHTATISTYLQVVEERADLMILPRIDRKPTRDDCFFVEVNQKAGTGLVSSQFAGATHATADKYLRPLARDLWQKYAVRPTPDTSLWSVGGRERFEKIREGKDVRSRFLVAPEGYEKIIALTYAQPFYKRIVPINKDSQGSENLLGCNFLYGGYEKFMERVRQTCRAFESDASRHDQNTSREQIIVAFAMTRACFPEGTAIDNHFLHFLSGFLNKFIAIPGRFIYSVRKGIPTGSPFTSIIVTFCQWLQLGASIKEAYPTRARDFDIRVYGDDNNIGIPDDLDFDAQKFFHVHQRVTGHTLDPCEVRCTSTLILERTPTFLKTLDFHGLPARPLEDTFRSMTLFPKYRGYWDLGQRVTGSLYICPFNFKGMDVILRFRKFCRSEWLRKDKIPEHIWHVWLGPAADRISRTAAMRNSVCSPARVFERDKPSIPWLLKSASRGGDDWSDTVYYLQRFAPNVIPGIRWLRKKRS